MHAHFQRWQQGPAWDNKLFTRNLVQVAWSGTNNGAILQPQKTGIGFTSPRQIRVLIIPKALTEADYHPVGKGLVNANAREKSFPGHWASIPPTSGIYDAGMIRIHRGLRRVLWMKGIQSHPALRAALRLRGSAESRNPVLLLAGR